MRRRLLILYCLIFFCGISRAFAGQLDISVEGDYSLPVLTADIQYLENVNDLSIDDVLIYPAKFQELSDDSKLSRKSDYWLKMNIKLTKTSELKQNLGNRLYFYTNKNDYVDAYLTKGNQKIQSFRTGYMYPMSEKLIKNASYYGFFEISD